MAEINEAKELAAEKKRDILLRSSQTAGYGQAPSLPQYVSLLFALYGDEIVRISPRQHDFSVCGVAHVIWKENSPVFDVKSGVNAARKTIPGYGGIDRYQHWAYVDSFLKGHLQRGILVLGKNGYVFSEDFRQNAVLDKWTEKYGIEE